MTETKMDNGQIWYTVKSMAGFEECSQSESMAANSGNLIRFMDWNTGTHTFNRSDCSTSGRQVSRGPRTIWLRKVVP